MSKFVEVLLFIAAAAVSCGIAFALYLVEERTGILVGVLAVLVGLVFLSNFVYRKYTGKNMKWVDALKNNLKSRMKGGK